MNSVDLRITSLQHLHHDNIKSFGESILQTYSAYAIMPIGKRMIVSIRHTKRMNPRKYR